MKIPSEFTQTIQETFGSPGELWLAQLPALLEQCEERWAITIGNPFPLSYNYVTAARCRNGTDVVVKAGVPNPELTSEMQALQLYDGDGMVRLLDVDRSNGVMLLERVSPGIPLAAVNDDDEATIIAADMMQRLRHPVPPKHQFRTVAGWSAGLKKLRQTFDGGTGPLPKDPVERAEVIYATYLASPEGEVVLHGDFHHENVLSGTRSSWLIIDPKGLVGEPAYEVGAYLRNYLLDKPDPQSTLARRVDIFAEYLGFERDRMLNWGLAVNVLSAWWSVESHGRGWEGAVEVARMCDELNKGYE